MYRTVNKSIANTTQREFLEKKIWFRESDTIRTIEEEQYYKSGHNDIYVWISSVPDSFYPTNKKYVRADSILGINRFGKRRDGGPGCIFESISQNDCKINSFTMNIVKPLLPKTMI